jgi:hypothetical protein
MRFLIVSTVTPKALAASQADSLLLEGLPDVRSSPTRAYRPLGPGAKTLRSQLRGYEWRQSDPGGRNAGWIVMVWHSLGEDVPAAACATAIPRRCERLTSRVCTRAGAHTSHSARGAPHMCPVKLPAPGRRFSQAVSLSLVRPDLASRHNLTKPYFGDGLSCTFGGIKT